MFRLKDCAGPARFGRQSDFHIVSKAFIELAIFDKALELMVLSLNFDLSASFKSDVSEKQKARLPKLLQVTGNRWGAVTAY